MQVGVSLNFFLGQRVRTPDGLAGKIVGLYYGDDGGIGAHVVLDEPIIVPAAGEFAESRIHRITQNILDLASLEDSRHPECAA